MLSITIVSNYLNHHTATLADSAEEIGLKCTFITTQDMSKERKALGYTDIPRNYVIDTRQNKRLVNEQIMESDIVIATHQTRNLISGRLELNRFTLILSERLFKPYHLSATDKCINLLRTIKYMYLVRKKGLRNRCYFLLLGDYAIQDHVRCGVSPDRVFRFGYFPDKSHYDNKSYSQTDTVNVLWCGRFLKWKYPDRAVHVVKQLESEGYRIKLTIIGNGPMKDVLNREAKGSNIHIIDTGASPKEVRRFMNQSDIFLFTSGYAEGWGCVLNEAMAEGMATISSIQAGASTFLLNDRVNGLIYDGSEMGLYIRLKWLLNHQNEIKRLGTNAKKTIDHEWNSDQAIMNLVHIYHVLKNGGVNHIKTGPCSVITS